MPKTKKRRGSSNLGVKLQKADVDKLVTLASRRGMSIIDWEELGQPAPDWVRGTFHGKPRVTADVLRDLLKLRGIRDLNILIRGTPRPDLAELRVSLRNSTRPR